MKHEATRTKNVSYYGNDITINEGATITMKLVMMRVQIMVIKIIMVVKRMGMIVMITTHSVTTQ